MNGILKVEELSFQYPNYPELAFPPLFRGLGIRLSSGEMAVLLGKPESGKTTLARILTALIPRHTGGALTGYIEAAGRVVTGSAPYELLEHIGLVSQNPDEQILTGRCTSEVAFAMESLGYPRETMQAVVERVFSELGIVDLADRNPATLSGGEKRKLLLACLCAVDPSIFVLDEMLEEIDPPSRRHTLKYLKDRKKTVLILSSKYTGTTRTYAQSTHLLAGGCISTNAHAEPQGEFLALAQSEGVMHTGTRSRSTRTEREPGRITLEARDLRFRYPTGSAFALDVENLALYRGETVSLLGRNGSGKSTLGKLLCGLLVPERGNVRIDRHDGLVRAAPADLNRFTAYMFQSPDLQIFLPTVEEELAYNLRAGSSAKTPGGGSLPAGVREAIELFKLPGARTPPTLMSYGARKRLQAASYYLLNRPLVILDEADSGLSARDFFELLALFEKQAVTIVIITHDVGLATQVSERILLMERGRLVSVYDPHDFGRLTGDFEETGQPI